MSLLETIATGVDQHADDWLDKGLSGARKALDDRDETIRLVVHSSDFDRLPEDARRAVALDRDLVDLGRRALDGLEARKASLVALGRARFAAAFVQLGAGQEVDARRLALATGSTFLERRAASAGSTEATIQAVADRERAYRELKELGLEIGTLALKAAVPILLAAL